MPQDLSNMLGMMIADVMRSDFGVFLEEVPVEKEFEGRHDLVFRNSGVGIVCDAQLCVKAIHLHRDGHERFRGFAGGIPNVSFEDTRGSVRSRLGNPSDSGSGMVDPILGQIGSWDRYNFGKYVLHLEYGEDGVAIMLVTLMRPDSVRY